MPVPKDQRLEIAEKLRLMGLPVWQIADIIGWSEITLRKDFKRSKVEKLEKKDQFEKIFKMYVAHTKRETKFSVWESLAMEMVLRIGEQKSFLEGVYLAYERLKVDGYLDFNQPYIKLLAAIVGLKTRAVQLLTGDFLWNQFIRQCSFEDRWPASEEEMRVMAVDFLRDDQKMPDQVYVPVKMNEFQTIMKEVLETLTFREQEVLTLRFGLSGQPAMRLDETGRVLFVTQERIRQIEAKALRKLRHPSKFNKFKRFALTLKYVFHLYEENEMMLEDARKFEAFKEVDGITEKTILQPAVLFKPVEEFELFIRTANCLQNLNIRYLGELALKTEQELLKSKNFGRKSLKEVKEILAEHNLTLGMSIPGFGEMLEVYNNQGK